MIRSLLIRVPQAQAQATVMQSRHVNTVPDRVLERARKSRKGFLASNVEKKNEQEQQEVVKYSQANRDYKFIYPDFLPNPVYYFRDKLRERLEREDMIARRKQITIPEFYVGSILAVSVSDPYAPNNKTNRFVGICIRRDGYQLRHTFTLRNVIDGQGVEIQYDMYNPTLQSIEVLKLEKRLDDNLTYLQDCPAEHSTIPFDMQPVKQLPGTSVPLNLTRVPLNPKPWRHRWDRKSLRGVTYPSQKRAEYEDNMASYTDQKPYERWDMMKTYRESTHDHDFAEIVKDVKKYESEVQDKKQVFVSSKKLAKARQIPAERK